MGRRRHLEPFECEITGLGAKGAGRGIATDGRPILVRGAPPGSRVAVVPAGLRKGIWRGRRTAMIRPAAAGVTAPCPQFGTCGGCVLQELGLDAQRSAKQAFALDEVARGWGLDTDDPTWQAIRIHPVRGGPSALGYRNKVELSFGVRRWLAADDHASGLALDGRFLGFHAPGRFDRVVDAPTCHLVSEGMNRILTAVRQICLADDAPLPYDPLTHEGAWRHLMLREAGNQRLAVLFTTSDPAVGPFVDRLAEALDPLVVGWEWRINDAVADVAQGEVVRSGGRPWLEQTLGGTTLRVGPETFVQTNAEGCIVLYDTVAEALGRGGTLLDLYCGAGAIGLYLAEGFERVIGLEERASAVADAQANAAANGVAATYQAVRVEDALQALVGDRDTHVVVDPPRAGLHPRVADRLAHVEVGSLVYVACRPASLGRDAAIFAVGGWRLTDLWTVDLFPQTGHIEVVGRFSR